LVTSVPRRFSPYELIKLIKLVVAWRYDKDTGIEYIWPTDIRGSREFVRNVEKMRKRSDRKDICIKKDDLLKLSEAKDM
jgi:hypothetical protein